LNLNYDKILNNKKSDIQNRFELLRDNYTVEGCFEYIDFMKKQPPRVILENPQYLFSLPMISGTDFLMSVMKSNDLTIEQLQTQGKKINDFINKCDSNKYKNDTHMKKLRECVEYIQEQINFKNTNEYITDDLIYKLHLNYLHYPLMESALIDELDIIIQNISDKPETAERYEELVNEIKKWNKSLTLTNALPVIIKTTAMVIGVTALSLGLIITLVVSVPLLVVGRIINNKIEKKYINSYIKVINKQINQINQEILKSEPKKKQMLEKYLQSLLQARHKLNNYNTQQKKKYAKENLGDMLPIVGYEDDNYNNDIEDDEIKEIDYNIRRNICITENYLMEYCKLNDINYADDEALLESYNYCENYINNDNEIVEEGILKAVWEIWKAANFLVKKVAQAIVWLWKTIIGFFKVIWNKIRELFNGKKHNDFKGSVKTSFISLEGANVREITVNSYRELESHVLKSCDSISREINKFSVQQPQIVEQIQRQIEKQLNQNSGVHESSILSNLILEAKIVHGKSIDIDTDISDAIYGEEISKSGFSINNKDILSSKYSTRIEEFDKHKYKFLLESKSIVEEYKAFTSCEFDNIISFAQKSKQETNGVEDLIYTLYKRLTEEFDIDKNKVKEYLIDRFFEISDDPKVIKQLLSLRLNYNKKIVNLLEKMLRNNYKILGLTDEEVEMKIQQFHTNQSQGIKDIKQIVLNNKSKFDRGNGFIDLRPLGLGVIFGTSEKTGLEQFTSIDRLLQTSMRYDCIIVTHAKIDNNDSNNENERIIKDIEKQRIEKYKECEKIKLEILDLKNNIENEQHHLIVKSEHYKYLYERNKISKNEYEKIISEIEKKSVELKKNSKLDELSYKLKNSNKLYTELDEKIEEIKKEPHLVKGWFIQPVRTEHAGPFTNINDLVRQVIREGYKKIFIISCNVGHYELDDDIKNTKGVIINHAQNSLLAESLENIDSEIEYDDSENDELEDINDEDELALVFITDFIDLFNDDNDEINIESFNNLIRIHNKYNHIINEGVGVKAAIATKDTGMKVVHGLRKAGDAANRVKNIASKVPEHVDNLISDVINAIQKADNEERRNRIIEGGFKLKLYKLIRRAISLGVLFYIHPALAAISFLGHAAMDEHLDNRQRDQILKELEAELQMVNEKIEDARSDQYKEKKYELMRIKNKLEDNISKIKYRLN
jgi:hypothetical protein